MERTSRAGRNILALLRKDDVLQTTDADPIILSADEFALWAMSQREDTEDGSDNKNEETFGTCDGDASLEEMSAHTRANHMTRHRRQHYGPPPTEPPPPVPTWTAFTNTAPPRHTPRVTSAEPARVAMQPPAVPAPVLTPDDQLFMRLRSAAADTHAFVQRWEQAIQQEEDELWRALSALEIPVIALPGKGRTRTGTLPQWQRARRSRAQTLRHTKRTVSAPVMVPPPACRKRKAGRARTNNPLSLIHI